MTKIVLESLGATDSQQKLILNGKAISRIRREREHSVNTFGRIKMDFENWDINVCWFCGLEISEAETFYLNNLPHCLDCFMGANEPQENS